MTPHSSGQFTSYLITAAVIVLLMVLRLRRAGRTRPLKLEQLWVLPGLYLIFVVGLLAQAPPQGTAWGWCVAALIVGGVIGWYRGRLVRINLDPQTHVLNQQASPAAVIFLGALVAIRFALRTVLAEEAQTWHVSATMIVDVFLLLAFGLIAAQRLEMFLRGRQLLNAAGPGN